MRKAILLVLLVIPGAIGAIVFAAFALSDYAALLASYQAFAHAAQTTPSSPAVFITEATQNIHRINVFAEGVWCLLSAIYAAIGVHGLCVNREHP